MTSQQDQISGLVNSIQKALGQSISLDFTNDLAASDLFEAFVFCLVVEAAKLQGALVDYRSVDGTQPKAFVFRRSPGYIYSKEKLYTHAVLSFPKVAPLEVHAGVRVSGKSAVLHECDVAVIEQFEAATCRFNRVPPRSSKVVLAVECKFYSTLLELGLARSFMGLAKDLSSREVVFVTNSRSDSVEKLLSAHKQSWDHNIVPDEKDDIQRLLGQFRRLFKDYVAKNSK